MSGFTLDKQGYKSHFAKGKWKLTKGSLIAAKGEACYTLYKTQGEVCNDELYAIEGNSLELWHKTLGHMSEKGLQVLAGKFLILLAKNESLSSCDHCLVRKQYMVSFSSKSKKKLEKLELVGFDVCGPMDMKALGGNKCFVIFIDSATRKVWI